MGGRLTILAFSVEINLLLRISSMNFSTVTFSLIRKDSSLFAVKENCHRVRRRGKALFSSLCLRGNFLSQQRHEAHRELERSRKQDTYWKGESLILTVFSGFALHGMPHSNKFRLAWWGNGQTQVWCLLEYDTVPVRGRPDGSTSAAG